MTVYRALGNAFVSEEEYRGRLMDGSLAKFLDSASGGHAASLDLEYRGIKTSDVTPPPTPFVPVGLGQPLTVMIRRIYTGRYPSKNIFGGRKDMLVVSAMKGFGVYEASPRAVNYLTSDVGAQYTQQFGSAMASGTPLVFYTPALTQADSVVSFEFIFDSFPKDAIDAVGSTLTALGGLPVFAPASASLLAAGILVKLGAKLGEAIFDGSPEFEATDPITFALPGAPSAVADFRLVVDPQRFDPAILRDFQLRGGDMLVDVGGNEYKGECPYLVLSLDGAPRKQYEGFMPTAATAALLERFYKSQAASSTVLEGLIEAMKLANDMRFRSRAESVKKEIDALAKDPAKQKAKIDEYNALAKNILTEALALPSLP